MRIAAAAFACTLVLATAGLHAQQETIVSIQVHGNTITPDADVIRDSGLSEGAPFSEELIRQAAARLKATKRFDDVDVLKRYASISDPSQVMIVIQVDEGPVRIDLGPLPGMPGVPGVPSRTPRVVKRGPVNVMFVPLLDAEDGYGVAYGAQMAITGHRSTSSRVVVPLSWGGDKRASAEFQKEFAPRLAPRLRVGGLVQRRTHPFFDEDADRKRVWGRVEWPLVKQVRAGATVAWQKSSLLNRDDTSRSIGGDIILDTRIDPVLPRNAVFARASVDRLAFSHAALVKTELEAIGYIGLYRGNVLVVRALREGMNHPAPPYFKSILGGASNLRGFRAGYDVGDTLVAASLELRTPLTSPLHIGQFGTSLFVDAGTTYDMGRRFSDEPLRKGVGGGIWATAALFRISLMVAHGIGSGNRVHFGAGLTF